MSQGCPPTPEARALKGQRISQAIRRAWSEGKYPRVRDPELVARTALKISATKIAKVPPKACAICGQLFRRKPCRMAYMKFCSAQCAGLAKSAASKVVVGCVKCGRVELVNPSRYKRPTGQCQSCWYATPKPNFGKTMTVETRAKWEAALHSQENRNRTSKLHLGAIRTTAKSKRFNTGHARLVDCFVKSPAGLTYHVHNTNKFVHEHERLFEPEDVVWKQEGRYKNLGCRASNGIRVIARGARMSWKGWTLVSRREGWESVDLIGRNPVPPEAVVTNGTVVTAN